jgi:hypothetical protein
MKQGLETRPGVRRSASLLVILALMVGTQTGCSSKQTAPEQASNQRVAEPVNRAATVPASSTIRKCPTFFSSLPEPLPPQHPGVHTVILSWTASARDAKHADADGYCVYRGILPDGKHPDDASLVRVNSEPFQGTSCTDNVVETGKTYFYRVKAISTNKITSTPSDYATAQILDRKPSNPVVNPPPLCETSTSK